MLELCVIHEVSQQLLLLEELTYRAGVCFIDHVACIYIQYFAEVVRMVFEYWDMFLFI